LELTQYQTETELIAGLKAKNETALVQVYDRYYASLSGIIFKYVNDVELTEELIQETFVKIWLHIDSYDHSKGRLFTWMVNIARNLSIDKLRSADYKTSQKTEVLDNSVHNNNLNHSEQLRIDHIDMAEIVQRLRPEQKNLIDLIYFKGYTQAEVADKLKIPLGTVKTRVRAAIVELRKYFKVVNPK